MSESVNAPASAQRVKPRSREAVLGKFEEFMEEIIDDALSEFEPLRVVNINRLPGNSTAKSVLRPVIEDELRRFRANIENQFGIVMDYAETGDTEKHRREFLRSDIFYQNFEGSDRRRLERDLTERMKNMGDDMAPLLKTGEDNFWNAAVASYDEDEARRMLPKHFAYTDTVKGYQEDLNLTVEIGSGLLSTEIEYTDEAMRVLGIAETNLRNDLGRRVDEFY
ncbi:MAG: hypothetical protein ACI9QA_000543 [Methanobacteriota archaeon]|jgi:hypothetical protein